MSRVLVTGAAGFTGKYLGPRLSEDGHEVYGLSSAVPDSSLDGYAEVYECDLADSRRLEQILNKGHFDKIVHLAAIANVAHGDPAQFYAVNMLGTRTLLDLLRRANTQPSAVLLASSANIYGNATQGVIDESAPPAPVNDYAVSKYGMELIASLFSQQLPLIIARPFNYTGRGQSGDFVIAKIIDHVRRRAKQIELGALDVARDFSDVRMVVDAYARLIGTPAAIGKTLNVCSGRAVELSEILKTIGSIAGFLPEIRVNPAFLREGEVQTLHGSNQRLEGVIGSLKAIPLTETLRWMLQNDVLEPMASE
jgi:nucleoside-diphosphate-sugar epimerase